MIVSKQRIFAAYVATYAPNKSQYQRIGETAKCLGIDADTVAQVVFETKDRGNADTVANTVTESMASV